VREAIEAIRRWEPRVAIDQVHIQINTQHIIVRVQWRVTGQRPQRTEVPYARTP
jgi:phage baseplate assembly protein W